MKKYLCKLMFACAVLLMSTGFISDAKAAATYDDITASKVYTGTISKQQRIYGSNNPAAPVVITISGTVTVADSSFDTFSVKSGYVKFVGRDSSSKLVVSGGLANKGYKVFFIWDPAHVEMQNLEIDGSNVMKTIEVQSGELVIKAGARVKNSAGECVTVSMPAATLRMEGGTVYGQPGTSNYPAIGVIMGKLYMTGGVIQGVNTGHGIVVANGSATLTGGTVKDFARGVDKYMADGELVVGDAVTFANNEADIYLRQAGILFSVRGDFRGTASVAVGDRNNLQNGAKRQITKTNTDAKMQYQLTSARAEYEVGYENGYLYLAMPHKHKWQYTSSGNQIFATCISQIRECEYAQEVFGLTLSAEDIEYTGTAYNKATVENEISEKTGDAAGDVIYYQLTGGKEVKLSKAPTEPGNYMARVTIKDVTAEKAFSITKKPEENKAEEEEDVKEDVKEDVPDDVIKENTFKINAGLKVTQTGKKITVTWGEVSNADGYKVYLQYCSKKFGKPAKVIKNANKTKASFDKIGGKKINLKKNFKVYVTAYKISKGKEVTLGKSIAGHVVGRKNSAYTNVKRIKVSKTKFTLKVGKSATIKAKTVLTDKKKKQLSNKHAKEFRYASDNKKVAKVSKNGKITAVGKGTCNVYVYARNGCAKKIVVKVK